MRDVCADCKRQSYCMYPCESWLIQNEKCPVCGNKLTDSCQNVGNPTYRTSMYLVPEDHFCEQPLPKRIAQKMYVEGILQTPQRHTW